MNNFLTLDDVNIDGRRVLVRSDLNVPLTDDGEVADDFRIRAALPTIERLRAGGAAVVLASHLGRPTGPDPNLQLDPVARRLSELGGFPVDKLATVAGPGFQEAVAAAEPGAVIMLENTRFEPGEKQNDSTLAARLAAPVDLFVLDAFGTAHRAHASTVGVVEHVRSAAGPLVVAEVRSLERLIEDPGRPFTVVLGGAKISDKLPVIEALLPKVDAMLIGGGMCFTLLAAQGHSIGDSLFEEDRVEEVAGILSSDLGSRIHLPSDLVVADGFRPDARSQVVASQSIPDGWMGLDIGPRTAESFAGIIRESASVFWNGPMGVFEWEPFRTGTETIGAALRGHNGYSVVGGGDSVAAVRLLDIAGDVSHVSTGGGAGLEFLEGRQLPALTALERWVDA